MFKSYTSLALCAVLCCFVAHGANASTQAEKETQRIAKVKRDVAKRMVDGKTRVAIRLRNGKEQSGYLDQPSEEGFVLKDLERKIETTILYKDVNKFRTIREGEGLSTGEKVFLYALGFGALALGGLWNN